MQTIEQKLSNDDIIEAFDAYNNVLAWEYEGSIYVDSMRSVDKLLSIARGIGLSASSLHEEFGAPLHGIEETGLIFGGRKTVCNVIQGTRAAGVEGAGDGESDAKKAGGSDGESPLHRV